MIETQGDEMIETRSAAPIAASAALYLLLAGTLALQQKGLQYDEALMVLGTVQMRNSPAILPLPQDPDTWQCMAGRCFPLMTVSYVGAFKEYLTLPGMILFGSTAAVVRLTSICWAGLAIWGIGRFAGSWAALLLALNPSFADQTAFDNGAVVGSMGALGLMAAAVAAYLERPGWIRIFLAGTAAGVGFWCRANFLWLLIGVFVGWAPEILRFIKTRRRHASLAAAGFLLGSLPFWIYQTLSNWGTLRATGVFHAEGSWPELILSRGGMFARVLLADSEHQAIWNGPLVPPWQLGLMVLAAGLTTLACFLNGPRARGCAIAYIVYCAFLFTSKLPVGEHHFIATLPLAAAVCALGGAAIIERAPRTRWGVYSAAAAYIVLALYWQESAIAGVRRTGGTAAWSDAILDVRDFLQTKHAGKTINILDWGLQNNLFVLSDTRLHTREEFDHTDVSQGGLFLLNGPENTYYKAPRARFLKAMSAAGIQATPIVFRERGGRAFAELWDLDSKQQGSFISFAGPLPEPFTGFHEVEGGGWRWTKGSFTIAMNRPSGDAELVLDINVADASLKRLGPLVLTARIGPRVLGRHEYREAGPHQLVCRLGTADRSEPVVINFELNKFLNAGEVDGRELGIIVTSAAIHPAHW